MIRYLLLASRRGVTRAKSLHLLTVLGVALGVASVLSIQVLNQNALAAFSGSVQAVSSQADLSVIGRTPVMADSLYPAVLSTRGVARAWPLFQVSVNLAGQPDVFLDMTGIDLLQPISLPIDSQPDDLSGALSIPGWVAITPTFAGDAGLDVGDSLIVTSGSRRIRLIVGALVDFQRITPLASSKLAVMDISQAQQAFDAGGALTQIDVRVTAAATPADVAERLRRRLGQTVDVLTPDEQRDRTAGLVSAFRLNLTAMSLISVFVGLFVVFSSTQASLVRRRAEFGLLRSLGASRGQLLFLILTRTLVLGALGVAIGLPLGYWVATVNADLVSATLTNIYLLREIEAIRVAPALIALSAGIGLGGALTGALVPAIDMSRRDPSALLSAYTLHEQTRDAARPLAAVGLALLVACGVWYWTAGRGWQPAGFVLAVALLLGLPLMTPLAVRWVSAPVGARDFGLRFSIRSLAVRLQSTAVAVASLAVAVSMLAGITIMIGSFRQTVEVWIGSTVRADVYITTQTWARSINRAPLDPALVLRLAMTPGVRSVDRLRGFMGYTGDRRIFVAGVDMAGADLSRRFSLLSGAPDAVSAAMQQRGAILIGEPLARKENRWVGDSLTITGPTGPERFEVAGVRYDYGNESGSVIMRLETLQERFGPGPINSVALYVDPGIDAEALVDRMRAEYRDVPLVIRSNRHLRAEVLDIFDQTFAITSILQGMCLLIAACGITLTLLILAQERVSELALYCGLGASRRQIFGLFVGKGFFMGAFGMILGLVGGVVLAVILVFVVNRAYFGWTVQVYWPFRALFEQGLTIMVAAVMASIYPAVKASGVPATQLSRDDV